MSVAAEIGQRLMAARTAAGLSKHALSDRTGIERRHIRRWERGQCAPQATSLVTLVGAIPALDLHWVLTGDERPAMKSASR